MNQTRLIEECEIDELDSTKKYRKQYEVHYNGKYVGNPYCCGSQWWVRCSTWHAETPVLKWTFTCCKCGKRYYEGSGNGKDDLTKYTESQARRKMELHVKNCKLE